MNPRRAPRPSLEAGQTEGLVPLHVSPTYLAYDKRAGLLTVPGRRPQVAPEGPAEPSLWRLAEAACGERLWAVHRLDRDTSGLVLFARDAQTHRVLSLAFEHREVEKHYLAWVAPPPAAAIGALRHQLVAARRGFMRLAAEDEIGVLAETDYQTLAEGDGRALLDLRPRTGRTHQLRLQLAAIGSPIVGDPHYRTLGGPAPQPAARLWLHAWTLRFKNPGGNAWIDLQAPPPVELAEQLTLRVNQFSGSAT